MPAHGAVCPSPAPALCDRIQGQDVVRKIEDNPTGPNDRPIKEVKIVRSGVLERAAADETAAV